jgi:hypothetical protein
MTDEKAEAHRKWAEGVAKSLNSHETTNYWTTEQIELRKQKTQIQQYLDDMKIALLNRKQRADDFANQMVKQKKFEKFNNINLIKNGIPYYEYNERQGIFYGPLFVNNNTEITKEGIFLINVPTDPNDNFHAHYEAVEKHNKMVEEYYNNKDNDHVNPRDPTALKFVNMPVREIKTDDNVNIQTFNDTLIMNEFFRKGGKKNHKRTRKTHRKRNAKRKYTKKYRRNRH